MSAPTQTAAGPSGDEPSAPLPGSERSRWPRRLTGLALLLGAALLLGPPVAGRWLCAEFERLASAEIQGEVTLERLSLRLNGKVDLEGLRVVDAAGETVLFSPRGMVDVGLRSWLAGRKDLAVHVYGSELELVRDAEGQWNVERLLAAAEAAGLRFVLAHGETAGAIMAAKRSPSMRGRFSTCPCGAKSSSNRAIT